MTTASVRSSDDNPRHRILRLLLGRRFSNSALHDFNAIDDHNHRPNTCRRRRRRHRRSSNSFSSASDYHRLPQHHLLDLSVLKLDGSSFEVQVARSATVADLKLAVERVFDQTPDRQQQLNISWSHVWGHFCLCYDHRKLTSDKVSLRSFGIKDGEQLHFIRHLSMNYGPAKIHLKAHANVSSQQGGVSLPETKVLKKSLENEKEIEHADYRGSSKEFRNSNEQKSLENEKEIEHADYRGSSKEFRNSNEQSVDARRHGEFSLAHFLQKGRKKGLGF